MKIMFACGGTAGHINPAIAVANYIKEQSPESKIMFVGNPDGMEASLVAKAGYDFAPLVITGFYRKVNMKCLKHNVKSVMNAATATKKAGKIIEDFAPNVVMGTGGYVSGPVLRKAAKMGIKTLSHEQNAYPGMTTKLLSKYIDKLLLAVKQAEKYINTKAEVKVVGNPVREEIIYAKKDECRKKLGIPEDKFCLLSFGGSLGAMNVNIAIADIMQKHWDKGEVYHIHAMGKFGNGWFKEELLAERGVDYENAKSLDIREYIHNMAECLAAADVVICRAGATTLSELEASGKASILIPSPNVTANHQYHNAMVLVDAGAAVVIEEKDLTGDKLWQAVCKLKDDKEYRHNMELNAGKIAILDTNKRIYEEILDLIK